VLICKPKVVTDTNYSLNRGFSQYKETSLSYMIIYVHSSRILYKEGESL